MIARKKIKYSLYTILICSLLVYVVYQSRNLIAGPEIDISSPKRVSVTSDIIEIEGRALNIAFISLNGQQIFVDQNETFTEKRALMPGLNTFTIEAQDKYGQKKEEKIIVFSTKGKTASGGSKKN